MHSYGQELLEQTNYNKYLHHAMKVGLSQSWKQALGISSIFAAFFLFYAYSFSIGSILMLDPDVKNGDGPYTGGDVATCLFGIVFGAFSIAAAMPNVKAFIEGRMSGYVIYRTIERTPKIPLNDTTKKMVKTSKLKG